MKYYDYTALENERLDQIFFKHFDNAEFFNDFTKLNLKYIKSLKLKGGEIIKIPIMEKEKENLEKEKTPLLI